MTSRDGRERVSAELPKETKEALKQSDEPMWKLIDESVRTALGIGEETTETAFRRRIETIESELSKLDAEIDSLCNERETLQDRLEDERTRLDEYLDKQDAITEIQDRILDELSVSDISVYGHKSDLQELARREYGHETTENIEKVIGDLKDRRRERDVTISPGQFTRNARGQAVMTDGDPKFKALREQGDGDE